MQLSMVANLDTEVLRATLIDAVADVQDRGRDAVVAELAGGGGAFAIDSKEAECILVEVEDRLGFGELVHGAELEPEELTTFLALERLLRRAITRQEVSA